MSEIGALERYLERCWQAAAVPARLRADATQAVYASLLERLGRERFEAVAKAIGERCFGQRYPRESDEHRALVRAIWTVRAQLRRAKQHSSLANLAEPAATPHDTNNELADAVHSTLDHRRRQIILWTLAGMTPREIAAQVGLSPKTVNNQKSLAIDALRATLCA